MEQNHADIASQHPYDIANAISELRPQEQTMAFLASMVRPVGLEPDNGNKAAAMRNDTRWNEVEAAMVNPSMDDTLGIVEMIIRRESKDLAALGKRLVSMLETATKTGQQNATSPKVTKASTRKASSDPLPEPSTSSLPNTDGTTSESSD